MLHFLSWGQFLVALLLSTGLYYCAIVLLFYRKGIIKWLRKRAGLTVIGAVSFGLLRAQDGNVGIEQANTMIRGYYTSATDLLYAIAGIMGLIGAIKVYREFRDGHQDQAYRAGVGWFGGMLFVVLVSTVIRSFFGL